MKSIFPGYLSGMTLLQPRFAQKILCSVGLIFLLPLKAICADQIPASVESNGLRLEVSYEIHKLFPPPSLEENQSDREPIFQVEITSLLKNVSEHEIIVPTSTYEGTPTCWGGNRESTFFTCYEIGFRRMKDQVLQVSPYRYFPVALKPGESVELPPSRPSNQMKVKPIISLIHVEYAVDADYAARQGWWSGALQYDLLGAGDANKRAKEK